MKQKLIDFVEWYKKNEKEVYLMRSDFMVETYLKSINNESNESKTVNRNEPVKKFCSYCGAKLEHEIPTDANTKLVCNSGLCKMINGVR